MAGTIYSGTYFSGIVLSNPTTQLPATIASSAYVTNFTTLHNGDAIYGVPGTAWTLDNLGTITGTFGDGIQLASAGYVSNAGTITDRIGVDLAAGSTLTNSGTITGVGGTAVYFSGGGNRLILDPGEAFGGSVAAGSSVNNTLELAVGAGTGTVNGVFSNFGTLQEDASASWVVPGSLLFVNGTIGPGASLTETGPLTFTGALANSGTVSAPVTLTSGASLTNQAGGLITGAGTYVVLGSGGPATVSNLGTITAPSDAIKLASGGYVSNAGSISASSRGIEIDAVPGTVVNSGTIDGYTGIYLENGGNVTNKPGALISAGIAAVEIRGSGTLVNSGTIANTGTYAYTPAVSLGYPSSFTGLSGNSTLTNAGTITGANGTAVAFYGSANRAILDPGAVFGGKVDVTGTAVAGNTLELAAGTGIGTLSGFGTGFVGFGTVTVDPGASWQLAAANTIAAGYVVTDSGTLANAGSIASTVTLNAGATLDNQATGNIASAGSAVLGVGGLGTVVNAGAIAGTGPAGVGVDFAAAGSTLTNAGTITGAGGTAVAFYGSGNRLILDPGEALVGASTVLGTAAANNTLELAAGTVTGAIGSAFSNFGTLQEDASASWTVPGSLTFSDGTIAPGASLTEAGPLTFTGSLANSGAIAASVTLTAGASLTNQATGTISSTGNAVFGSGGPGTVVNAGTIAGTGAAGIGVDFAFSGSTLTNAGTIIGAGGTAAAFAGGGNRVIADPGAVFSGVVEGGTGSDTLELAAGSGTGILSGLGTSFIGFTTVALDPGAVWQVSDASAAPPAFTNDGTIVVGAAGLVFGAVSENSGSSGVIDVGGSGLAEFASTVAAGQTLVFTAPGNATLDQPGGFAGAVAGFLPGDTLDLAGVVANAASYASGVLTLTDNGAPVAGLNLSTPLGSRASFRLYPDGAGGTNLTVAARPGNIFSGFYPNGIVLNNPAVESPPTITATAYVTNTPGRDSVHATAGFAWTVTNYGRIAGSGNGISLAAPGVVLNSGNVAGANGIDLAAGGTITNSGTASGSANAGAYMGNGGYILNGASAAAGALLTGRYGIEIGGSAGSALLAVNLATIYGTNLGFSAGDPIGNTLVNAGTIGGGSGAAIQFGGGNDLLVIDPHAVFIGRVNGGAGANAIELAAGNGAGTLLGLGSKFVNFPSIYVDPGAVWHMAGVPATPPAFSNDGRIIVGARHSLVLGAVGEDPGMSGIIAVQTRGTLEFTGGVDPQQTVRFADNTGTVILGDPQDFGATIQGFRAGDTIDVKTVAADGFTYANGALTLTSGGNPMATLAISGNLGASQFALTPDGKGGTDVTAAAGQLFAFTFVYADGEAYYSGTVADSGSLGYARVVASGNPTISEPDGTYYLANDGPATTQPSGAVTVESYAVSPLNANAAQVFVPQATSQGQFDGHAGLGSESDQISVNGTLFAFSPSLEFHPLLAS